MGLWKALKNIMGGSSDSAIKTKKKIIDELHIEIVHTSPTSHNEVKLMNSEVFNKTVNYFEYTKKIKLSGWGEPFLHPEINSFIKLIKEKNKSWEIVTTGKALTPKIADTLLTGGLNSLTINFSYPHITLDTVAESLKVIIKKRRNPESPKIHLNYIMTAENISKLPSFIETATEINIDEISAHNLDFIFSAESNNLKIFQSNISEENRGDLIKQGKAKGKREYEEILSEAEKIANRKRIYFSRKPLVATEAVMCENNPLQSLFISWNGKTAPCQYLALENYPNLNIYFNDQQYPYRPYILGDITTTTDFKDIWESPQNTEFRKAYQKRKDLFNKYMEETFEEEPSASLLTNNYSKLEEQLAKHKLPQSCRKCYKAYGI